MSRDSVARGMAGAGLGMAGGNVFAAKARRILAHAQRNIITPVTASPPTVTVGTANANSTINTNTDVYTPSILPNDTRLTPVSGLIPSGSGNMTSVYIDEASAGSSGGWGVRFMTDAEAVDVCVRDIASLRIRVRIDGEWHSAGDQTVGTSGGSNFYYVKFDKTTAAPRVWEFFFNSGAQIRGFNAGKSAGTTLANNPHRIWKSQNSDDPKVMVFGDSYVYGVGAENVRDGFPYVLGDRLGITGIVASGAGGQGYVATSNNSAYTAIQRIADVDRFGELDLILICLGINDYNKNAAAVQAAATAFISGVRARQSKAIIGVANAWTGAGKIVPGAIFTAIADGYNAAKDAGMFFIDTSAVPAYLDASGGNSALYGLAAESPNYGHVNTAGHSYLGNRLFGDVVKNLQAMANWTYAGL